MKPRRAAALLAGLGALLLAPSCAGDRGANAGSGHGGAAASGALLRGTTWTLTWDTAGVILSEGDGFSLDTDRGYRVHVTSGWLVDDSVSLGLCDATLQDGGGHAASRFLDVRSAYAHEDGNASTLDLQHAEDLTHPLTVRHPWSAAFAAARYCRVHWLAGRGDPRVDSPEGIDLRGLSLVLGGTFARGAALYDLQVSTWWPQGYLTDLDAVTRASTPDDGEARIARITVKRSLGTLFDGIDLERATDAELAGHVLENLALYTVAEVELFSLSGR